MESQKEALSSPPSESPKPSEHEKKPDYDALVVLGKNWRETHVVPPESTSNLSFESRIGALAAGFLYEQGVTSKIIFSGGKTKEGLPSEAAAMAKYLQRRFPDIPEGVVLLEEGSTHTGGNAEEVAKLLKGQEMNDIALLTVGYHTQRAERTFKRFGLEPEHVYASDEVVKSKPEYTRGALEKFTKSGHMKLERLREALLNFSARTFDKNERIPKFSATKMSKRPPATGKK